MTRPHKHTSSGFGIFEMLLLVVILAIIGLCGWLFYQTIQPDEESIRDSAQQEQAIEKAKLTLQDKYFKKLTDCGDGDNRKPAQRILAFHEYLKVNSQADRAIMRGCNDTDQVFAKNKDGEWFPLFVIRADDRQDNAVRKACKIEDITTGFDDTDPKNQSVNALKKERCQNLEATYQEYLESLKQSTEET